MPVYVYVYGMPRLSKLFVRRLTIMNLADAYIQLRYPDNHNFAIRQGGDTLHGW